MKSRTIEQSVEQINHRLIEEGLPGTMNVRLLRHYQQTKSIPPPTQEGRFAKYNDEHVEAVVALRKAQELGVSSKAYTTMSNISQSGNPQATVASLGLNTPSWMANSLVGSVSSSADKKGFLDLFSTSSVGASAQTPNVFSNIKVDHALAKAVTFANASTQNTASNNNTQSADDDTKKHRSAALNALAGLNVPKASVCPGTPKARAFVSAVAPSQKISSRDVTEWTLDHDVRVQIPTTAFTAMSADDAQAFEAWMAQLPDLT